MLLPSFIYFVFIIPIAFSANKLDLQNTGSVEEIEEDNNPDDDSDGPRGKDVYSFLASRLNQDVGPKKKLPAKPYNIPGPQEPLPGRSHSGDYWPVFPFQNQYSGGVDLDPAISRHMGGDINIAVPSWGMADIYGRMYYRIHDTTTKIGYLNHPVNMLDLEKEDLVKLMSDPAVHENRKAHPTLPLGVLARRYAPMSCKPPMCNPYQMNFALGLEHDWGGADGAEGDIDIAMPMSKGIAYRFPFSGNVYAFPDNMTVTYGQNLSPIEPFSSLFGYQQNRDPGLRIPRKWDKRSIEEYPEKQVKRYKERMNQGQRQIHNIPERHIVSGETFNNRIDPIQQVVQFNPFGFPLPIRQPLPLTRKKRYMNPYMFQQPIYYF